MPRLDSLPDAKTRILDAAERLFMENGYAATSIRMITGAAGVPVALVNYHFGTKQGLMEAVYQLMGGLRSGMGYVGAHNLKQLFENTTFCEISSAGLRESHVHDVVITKEAPNYRIEN